jgi:hypothetical protein
LLFDSRRRASLDLLADCVSRESADEDKRGPLRTAARTGPMVEVIEIVPLDVGIHETVTSAAFVI